MVVVEGGNVLHHVKMEKELHGRGKCPWGEYVQGECPDTFDSVINKVQRV